MRMTPVTSPDISSIGYDLATRLLVVQYSNGATYEFIKVPPDVYANLMYADATSVYLDRYIRNKFPYRKMMRQTPVTSSSIKGVGYDPALEHLYVTFHNGATYEYNGVPAELYAELMNAFSMGAFFNRHIRRKFPTHKIWIERILK